MELDLLLLGKTGSCKSSAGNSILGRTAFKVVHTTQSITVFSKRDVSQLDDGRKIRVVDTPGVGDSDVSDKLGEQMFLKAIRESVVMSPQGYHALLFTVRYGNRMTKRDKEVTEHLKAVFGENFIKDHCILLLTCGDHFKQDIKISCDDWCKQQEGFFGELYREVNGRVVLFDNKGDETVKATQRANLLAMVDQLGGRRYTNKMFEDAQKAFQEIMKKKGIDTKCQEVRDGTSLVLAQIEKFETMKDLDDKTDHLSKLREQIADQLTFINTMVRTEWLQNAVTYNERAKDCVEKEVSLIMIGKDLRQKKADAAGNVTAEIQRLENMWGELEHQLRNAKDKLRDDSQKWRDDTNNNWLRLVSDLLPPPPIYCVIL